MSPLARLVLFMICLSLAGTLVAGAHYFAVDLPQQRIALLPPSNGYCENLCDSTHLVQFCQAECSAKYPLQRSEFFSKIAWLMCYDWCDENADTSDYFQTCVNECR